MIFECAEPILIHKETLRESLWNVIRKQVKDLDQPPLKTFKMILEFAVDMGVLQQDLDSMLKDLSRKCDIGILVGQDFVRFE